MRVLWFAGLVFCLEHVVVTYVFLVCSLCVFFMWCLRLGVCFLWFCDLLCRCYGRVTVVCVLGLVLVVVFGCSLLRMLCLCLVLILVC